MPQLCHIVRSTTVSIGSPQSRWLAQLESLRTWGDLPAFDAWHLHPYKAVVIGGPVMEQVVIKVAMPLRSSHPPGPRR